MKKILKIASLALLLGLQAGSIVAKVIPVNPTSDDEESAKNYPLHHAIARGRYNNAKRLIESGAWSRQATDSRGRTAAQFAAQCAEISPVAFDYSENYRENKTRRAPEILEALEKHSPGTLEYAPNAEGSPLRILEERARFLCSENQENPYWQKPCQAQRELIAKCRQAIEKYKPEQPQQ